MAFPQSNLLLDLESQFRDGRVKQKSFRKLMLWPSIRRCYYSNNSCWYFYRSKEECDYKYTNDFYKFNLPEKLIDSQFCATSFDLNVKTAPGDSGGPVLRRSLILFKYSGYI